jgi:hypothetical protein
MLAQKFGHVHNGIKCLQQKKPCPFGCMLKATMPKWNAFNFELFYIYKLFEKLYFQV